MLTKKLEKLFLERDEHDRKNNIVRLKLPEKYMTDDDGRPVILTPEVLIILENIHNNNNNNNNNNNSQNKTKKEIIEKEKITTQKMNLII